MLVHAGYKQDRSKIQASYQRERYSLSRSTHLCNSRIEAVYLLSHRESQRMHRGCSGGCFDGDIEALIYVSLSMCMESVLTQN